MTPRDPPAMEIEALGGDGASEGACRLLVDHLSVGVFLTTGDGAILQANPALLRLSGYDADELRALGRDGLWAEPGARERCVAAIRRDGGVSGYEGTLRRKDGSTLPVAITAVLVPGAGGAPERIAGSVEDVSARKARERELLESERKFSQAFHGSPGYCAISTLADGRFIDVNEPFARSVGYRREEIIGRTAAELAFWSDPDLARELRRRLQAEGKVTGFESTFRHRTGELGYGLVSAAVIDVNGVPCLLTETIDVTERRRAIEQLALVKDSIDRVPHAAYWVDARGRFLYANDAGCSALGYSRDALLGLRMWDVNPRATPARWAEVYRDLAERGATTLTSEHRRSDGSTFPVEVTTSLFRWGDEDCCVAFATDLTERVRMEAERDALRAKLDRAQRLESVGRLAGGVAHDFNNMLTMIQMGVEHALPLADPGSALEGDLEDIRTAAARSAALTRQLLAFARQQTIAPRRLDLNETIAGMLKMLRRLLGENLELVWRPADALWPIEMDPTQIDQLLANLCVNARDAIADVGRVAIETANRTLGADFCATRPGLSPGDYVQLSVTDDGCGMDAQTMAHLCEPFYTTKPDGKGTGLGLATVYGIISQNGGHFEVSSTPARGTTFTILLPRTREASTRAGAEQAPSGDFDVARKAPEPGRETILVVEDEAVILRMLVRLLARAGYAVMAARTPGEALALAREHRGRLHLLVSDVVMPEMNGRELAKRVLAMHPSSRCLFMSGYTADVIAHHGVLEAGICFIQKPFSAEEMEAQIRALLDAPPGVAPSADGDGEAPHR